MSESRFLANRTSSVLTILGELHLFNIALRFSEVIYVQSLVYGKPAEISSAALSTEFASVMRLKSRDTSKAKQVGIDIHSL